MPRAAILDIDGTLVDTNYQHAVAWYRAFRQSGMGGDHLVAYFVGEERDAEIGDDIRAAEKALYLSMIEEVEAFEGARDFVCDLKDRGLTVVLASSAKANELDHYLDLLDVRDIVDAWTSSADVEQTKPDPDLVVAALEKAGTDDAVMVGDTPWDIEAAKRVGVPTIAVMTGGFGRDELREAGAQGVYDSLGELSERVRETPLG